MKIKIALLLAFSAILTAPALAEIKVLNPWVRPAGQNAALYMKILNTSDKPVKLVNVTTDISPRSEIHHIIEEDSKSSMQTLSFIEIPAQGSKTLEPGGQHIMLIDLRTPIRPADKDNVNVTLEFKDHPPSQFDAPVRKDPPN
jgi:copper(I)-binding protein